MMQSHEQNGAPTAGGLGRGARRGLSLLVVLLVLAAALAVHFRLPFARRGDEPLVHTFFLANLIPGEIKIYSPVTDPVVLFRRCDEEVVRCAGIFNGYQPDSELSRLNARAASEEVTVSPELATVLACAIRVGRLTDGAFDITVWPLVQLWKEAGRRDALPEPGRLAAVQATLGLDHIAFDPDTRRVRFLAAGTRIDLGGISKGYIADRLTAILKTSGVAKGLVNIGGNLRVFGGTPSAPFLIGIQHPWRAGELVGSLAIEDAGVSTSGDYEQFSVIDGRRYSHILDPRTGCPVPWSPSVTVLGSDAMTADALSTGLSVLGAERGLTVAATLPGVECLFVRKGDDGVTDFVYSPGVVGRFRRGLDADATPARRPRAPRP